MQGSLSAGSPESRAPWLSFSFTDQGKLLEVNRACSRLVGIPMEQLPGMPVGVLFTKAGQLFYQTHLFPILQAGDVAAEVFLLLRNQSGEPLPVLTYGTRWQQANGQWVNECHCAPVPQRRQFESKLIEARKAAEALVRENIALNQAKQALEDHQSQLDRRVRQLERANDELRQITRIVSHDLQEPIRKISVLIDYFRTNANPLAADSEPLFNQIDTICQATSRLVIGLRDYISLDSEEQSFTMVELEKVSLKAAQDASRHNDYTSDWLSTMPMPAIRGNAQQLRQLFFQVFDNAIKFRKLDVPLLVQVSADVIKENKYVAVEGKYQYTDHVRIRIQDNGIGFSDRYRSDVFLLLKRLEKSTSSLGLGLSISKKIVDNHYGTITADSSPGEGTTITIVLPL